MAKRKYESYTVATQWGEYDYSSYREALRTYCLHESATLYGLDSMGDVSVILSK